jgi:4-amino-4-deoxychorismate lyase
MSQWFRNGEAIATLAFNDRGLQYGDGLFETIAVRDGDPRLWEYHVERLGAGCERLRLQVPDPTDLRRLLDSALFDAEVDKRCCTAKIIVTSGVSQRGYGRETPSPISMYIGLFSAMLPPADAYRDGIDTMVCATRLARDSAMAGIKTLNRLEQVLASSECLEAGIPEGLTMDAAGNVICGTMSNVFLVHKKSIATPAVTRCGVAGVMRRHVIEMLGASGTSVDVRDISETQLLSADEVFLTNSQFGVLPVRSCGDAVWTTGLVTRNVMSLLAATGIDECRP